MSEFDNEVVNAETENANTEIVQQDVKAVEEQNTNQAECQAEGKESQKTETSAQKPLTRRQRWRLHKKQKRAALKEEYKDAPFLLKLFRLYLLKPLVWLLVLGIIVGSLGYSFVYGSLGELFINSYYADRNNPVDIEEIYAVSPIDEEGKNRIDALTTYAEDETWTICVYMIGSNLESFGENDLSEVTRYVTKPYAYANQSERSALYSDLVFNFVSEIEEKGMTLPEYFYLPQSPEASQEAVYDEVIATDEEGFSSSDIYEMLSANLGDNVKIVLQTGGSTRWSNSLVNPNKTQRFELSNGRMSEVANLPLQDSCSVDTLADFLSFCKENYQADHQILLLWDHGGGAFGYGSDDIFSSAMSNADIREALSMVYEADPENPAFELIGFDACLMANLEVCHELFGYGKYLAASEESEPGDGWDYTPWLEAFAQGGPTNGAKIGMEIADSYMNFYITQNINTSFLLGESAVTFSVIDLNKAEDAYNAYCDFATKALVAATEDQSVLAVIGRAGSRSVRFADSSYNVFNLVDLATFMDQLIDYFPEETSKVKDAVNDAVLYNRQIGYLEDSQGISVYFPVDFDGISGLVYYLKYINCVSDNDSIRALYYYKLGGCLNEELTEYALSIGCENVPVLDLTPIKNIGNLPVNIEDGNYGVQISEETQNLIQKYEMTLASYDVENDTITYFGSDNYAYLDGEGNLSTAFEGMWISINGQMLSLEIVDEAPSAIQYRTKVKVNGEPSYLLLSYDRDTEEISITGIRTIPDTGLGDIANVSDRHLQVLEEGDKIIPLYDGTDLVTGKDITIEGKSIKYKKSTVVEMSPIDNGKYLTYILVTDARGDAYYTGIVEFDYSKNGVENMQINEDFAVITTE